MLEVGTPVVAAVLLWWASTGVILYLDGLPRQTFKWSMLVVLLIGLAALLAAVGVRSETTTVSAYVGFASGLLVWAVPTAAFYLPNGLTGWARFRAAVETMLYHEILCIVGAGVLTAVLWSAPNKLALWTYLVLWAMHVSGKLNMFFGVPNLSEEFMPPHLSYLTTYMRKRTMNLWFPLSVSLATAVTVALVGLAWVAPSGSHHAVAAALLAVLAALAVIEHWLLVLPIAPMALWTWSLRSRVKPPVHPVQAETASR
jgi:putative photosynthetic complex assembly protein 2